MLQRWQHRQPDLHQNAASSTQCVEDQTRTDQYNNVWVVVVTENAVLFIVVVGFCVLFIRQRPYGWMILWK